MEWLFRQRGGLSGCCSVGLRPSLVVSVRGVAEWSVKRCFWLLSAVLTLCLRAAKCGGHRRAAGLPLALPALVCWLLSPNLLSSPLPVFLADNHAETFGWIARTFELDEPHLLVLIDAHSDATCVEKSEEVREQLRRVASVEERNQRIEVWRVQGRIQAFNWIEPLLPRPFERVLWVPRLELPASERSKMAQTAGEALDGRLEVEPRGAGEFQRRFEVLDAAGLRAWQPGLRRVILAVDLDFFAGMADAPARFEELWETALAWPGLVGVAFSVSSPWLTNGAEADRLVTMAVDAVRRTRGAVLEADFSVDDRPDASLRAGEITKAGGKIPRWDLAGASRNLRALFAAQQGNWRYSDRKRPLESLILRHDLSGSLTADGCSPDADGAWRVPAGADPVVRVRVPAGVEASGRVRWFGLQSAQAAYDLLPETGLGKGFSKVPGRWIYGRQVGLGLTEDFALKPEAWRSLLDAAQGCGRVLLEAEYETGGEWLPVAGIDLRVLAGSGFHAGLSECFGMPYVFGVALEETGWRHGVDTGWGSDCSNFLAQAWRRSGVRVEWGDPGRLRQNLATLAESATPASAVKFTQAMAARGVAVDFGRHVAALWEDREPLGVLDGGDLMVHHLGGRPEVLRLDELARDRGPFAVRTPQAGPSCRLSFAGDVVLAGDFGNGMVELTRSMREADLGLANLEGIPSQRVPERAAKFDFRFAAERLVALREAGVRVVSLANNHAADAGLPGLLEGRAAVVAAGLGVVGAGRDLAEALQPWHGTVKGVPLAVFGVSLTEAPAAGENQPGVLRLPDHAVTLSQALQTARQAGAVPVVIVHWGDEHVATPNAEQHEWARWLADHGVAVVAGAGPHVVQSTEFHGGAVIAYSLGNAVYPLVLQGRGSGAVWEVTVQANGDVLESRWLEARER